MAAVMGAAKRPPNFSSGKLSCPYDLDDDQVQLGSPVTTCQLGWADSPTTGAIPQQRAPCYVNDCDRARAQVECVRGPHSQTKMYIGFHSYLYNPQQGSSSYNI